MWSSWFDSKPKDDTTEEDTEVQKTVKIAAAEQKGKAKLRRISKSWFESPLLTGATGARRDNLEEKKALHNLLETDETNEPTELRTSGASVIARSKRFGSYLEPTRISDRPLYVVRQSDSDILKFKENIAQSPKRDQRDKFITIPILPADEMNSLTSEIKMWHKNRKTFKITFAIAIICGFMLLCASLVFTLTWYSDTDNALFKSKRFLHEGSGHNNVHMNSEVICLLLMAFGINIYRALPGTKLTRVIFYHVLILLVSAVASATGMYWTVKYHSEFSKNSDHFHSLHSWIGLVSYIFYAFCFLSGLWLLYYPANNCRIRHSRLSILTFMMWGAASMAGFFERALLQMRSAYSKISTPGIVINAAGVLLVVFCLKIRISVVTFEYRRRPKPQWDVIVYRSLEAIEDVYLEIHDMYDSFELWVKQVNQARMKALRLPRTSVRSTSMDSGKLDPENADFKESY